MHPMFVTLFIQTHADDLLAEEQDNKRRSRGQARQVSTGHDGRRRSPRSPAPPLTYEPARTGGGVPLAWPPCISPAARPPRSRLLPSGFTTRDLHIHLVPLLARHINDFLADPANASASAPTLRAYRGDARDEVVTMFWALGPQWNRFGR